MVTHALRHGLTTLGTLAARPEAFLIVIVYTAVWAWIEPDTLDFHGIATAITWMMTLFIQRSEHRDTQALHAKLDELLRANEDARASLARLDDEEPEEVERVRKKEQRKEGARPVRRSGRAPRTRPEGRSRK